MSAVMFDTLKRVDALETKTERVITQFRQDMENRFAKVEGELKPHRWMLGAILGGIVTLVLRSFF